MGRTACTGENVWSNLFSRLLFRPVFSIHYENGQETELSRDQTYGDRIATTRAVILNGRHIARLRQHRFETLAVFD